MLETLPDPFALTSDPGAYVPTHALETALDAATAALSRGTCPAIVGPTGLGKTLLLQLLAHQLRAQVRSVYVPFSTLSPLDFATLTLGLLDRQAGDDAERTLLDEVRRGYTADRPLLLLIDDAAGLPLETAGALHDWLEATNGALLFALAGLPGDALDLVLRKFGEKIAPIALVDGIGDSEVAGYVASKLEASELPRTVQRAFDPVAIEALRRVADGNPRQLHLACQAIVREAEGVEDPVEDAPLLDAPGTTAADLARVGEYRFVKGQFVDPETGSDYQEEGESPLETAATAPEVEGSRPDFDRETVTLTMPPEFDSLPRPPSQVDLTLTATSVPARPAPASNADLFPPLPHAEPREPKAFPMRAVAIGVAGLAAVLGGVVATQMDWGGSLRGADPVVERTVAPAAPPAVEPVPEPEPTIAAEVPEPTPVPIPEATKPEPVAPTGVAEVKPAPPVAKPPTETAVAPTSKPPAPKPEPEVAVAKPTPAPTVTPTVAVTEPTPPAPKPEPTPKPEAPAVAVTPKPEPEVPPTPAPAPKPVVPPPTIVSVSINATPWGIIVVDGKEIGETPLAGVQLTAGPHEFSAKMPDGSVRKMKITISEKNKTIVFE